jgi:hypothetical protein
LSLEFYFFLNKPINVMKTHKIFSYLLLTAGTILVIGCSDDPETPLQEKGISVTNGRLVFPDESSFGKAMIDIESGNRSIVNGRLEGFQYTSFRNSHAGNPEKEEVFTIDGFQVVANENRELQVGTKIYRFEGNSMKVFSESGELENEVAEVVQTITKDGRAANAREMNVWYTEPLLPFIIDDVLPDQVRYRLRAANSIVTFFYLDVETHPDYSPALMTVEAIRFWGGVCTGCIDVPDDLQNKYNTSTASFLLGYMSRSDYANHGVGLTEYFKVKRYNYPLSDLYGINNF